MKGTDLVEGQQAQDRERVPHLSVADALADAVRLLAVVVAGGLHRGEPAAAAAAEGQTAYFGPDERVSGGPRRGSQARAAPMARRSASPPTGLAASRWLRRRGVLASESSRCGLGCPLCVACAAWCGLGIGDCSGGCLWERKRKRDEEARGVMGTA